MRGGFGFYPKSIEWTGEMSVAIDGLLVATECDLILSGGGGEADAE